MAEIGVVIPPDLPARTFTEYARRADYLGFSQLWVVEDCFLRGGIAQAAVALAVTSRLRVGIGILPAGARNAAFAAMEIATLAELFPHRLIVGIGHGMPAWMRKVGAWPKSPLTLLEEYITAVKSMLAGELVSIIGQSVRLEGVRLNDPVTVVPRVFAGVRGPKSVAVSGRVADGTILAEPVTPEYLRVVRSILGDAAPSHEIVAYNVAAIDDSSDVARRLARGGLRWIGEPDWDAHIAALPFADDFRTLRRSVETRGDFVAKLPDEWVDQLAIVGSPADAKGRIAQLADAGADHVILVPTGESPLRALESLARAI